MNILDNIQASDRSGWAFSEHVTAPRNSCAGMLHFRRALMAILPGYDERIAGLKVRRTEAWQEYRYVIRNNEVSLDTATGILEGRIPTPDYPPLTDLPLFATAAPKVLTLLVPQSAAKSINRKLSLNTRILVFADVTLFHSTMRGAA